MTDTALAAISDRNSAAPVQWADTSLQVGSIHPVSFPVVSDWWWPTTYPVNTYISTGYPSRPNPTEMAFKIVAKLMEDGPVKDLTVTTFVKLVDDVAKIVQES